MRRDHLRRDGEGGLEDAVHEGRGGDLGHPLLHLVREVHAADLQRSRSHRVIAFIPLFPILSWMTSTCPIHFDSHVIKYNFLNKSTQVHNLPINQENFYFDHYQLILYFSYYL